MLTLNERKVNHLQELIELYYALSDNDDKADQAYDVASTIVGILDYILSTDTYIYREDDPHQDTSPEWKRESAVDDVCSGCI